MKKWILPTGIVVAIIAAIALLLPLISSNNQEEAAIPEPTEVPVKITVIEPSCIQAGYTMHEDPETGIITIHDEVPALGHTYGDWAPSSLPGGSVRECTVCGDSQERLPAEDSGISKIEFKGSMDGISKDQRVLLEAAVTDEANSFSCYSYTSWQGHSTLINDKKNYTVRFFSDPQLTDKHRLVMRPGWQLEHKYVLKANYADVTQSRNLICADIWSDMVAIRQNVHPRLARTSNYGAVDGFPVSVWLNDEFIGLYTLNLHKDDDLYQMQEGILDAVIICNAQSSDESLFRAAAAFNDENSDWEVEFSSEEETQWAQKWFNEMIGFIMESDDETFKANLSRYLDTDAAIDYLLFMYTAGLTDSAAKDLIMLTYEGSPWIPTAYDMEDAFGLARDGASAKSADEFLPVRQDDEWSSGTGSMLWDRLLQNFEPQIRERWNTLRQDVFSDASLKGYAENRLAKVPAQLIAMDLERYSDRTPIENPEEQILSYISQRLPLLDEIFG